MPDDAYASRLRFIETLHGLDAIGRTRLLSIENDRELETLFSVALEEQWFEVAAEIKHEMKRRGRELPVKS